MYAKDKANNKSASLKLKVNKKNETMHCELHEIILRL